MNLVRSTARRPRALVRRGVIVGMISGALLAGDHAAQAALPDQPDRRQVGFNNTVFALLRLGSTIYVGGAFTSAILPDGTSVTRNRLAAIDAGSGSLLPWNPSASDTVFALTGDTAAGTLYVGGRFLTVGGVTRTRLAAFDSSGSLLPWAPGTGGPVRGMDLAADGTLYVGGNFTSAGGSSRLRLAAFDAASGALRPWAPRADATVRDVEVDGDVFVGGDFATISGVSTGHVARIRPDGSVVTWADSVVEPVFALTVDGGRVYSAAGGSGGQVYAHNALTGARAWRRHGDGDVQSIDYVPSENSVVAGGHFEHWAGVDRRWAVELRASDGTMTGWGPTLNRGPWAVHATATRLYLGGRFTRISGVTARRFAQWSLA